MLYKGAGFLAIVWFGSCPPSPPFSISKLSLLISDFVCPGFIQIRALLMAMIEKKLARKNMSTEIIWAFGVICLVLLSIGK
jgi:hypothetical protein